MNTIEYTCFCISKRVDSDGEFKAVVFRTVAKTALEAIVMANKYIGKKYDVESVEYEII